MSALVVSNEGEVLLAERAVRTPWVSSSHWTARLFKNDYTPDRNVTLAAVTEADFPSYAGKDLAPGTWNPFVSVAGQGQSTYGSAPLSWNSTSTPQVIYGYYVTDNDSGILIWAERFDAPVTVTSLQAALVVVALSSRSQYEP